ncbi:MAG: hypothetical protein AB6733_20095 [Clostridiaceae bacterium]
MKLKKNTAIVISFAVGTMLFATSALAEVAAKSGYVQFKDAAKYTAESFTEKLSSYTTDMSFVLKDNETVISSENSISKYDVSKQARETTSTNYNGTNKTEGYYYTDRKSNISYNSDQDTYYVNEFTNENETTVISNPFKEKSAGDVEKIADAIVGDLADYVVVTENPDGSKELNGSLSEAQIPALVNAVVSFQFKNMFTNGQPNANNIPTISKDIFIKEIKGKVVIDKDGLIQSVLGTGIICGKDESGKEHNLTFEILGKVSSINSTVVNKPSLDGKKVEKSTQENYSKLSNPSMYIGKYKSDIVIEKDGKFEKIGERIVEIKAIDDKNVSGTYSEEFKEGYESYATNARNFEFNVSHNEDPYGGNFNSTTSSGKNIQGMIHTPPYSSNIYFNINEAQSGKIQNNNGEYHRIFE